MTEVPLALAPALAGLMIGPLRLCEAAMLALTALFSLRMLASWWPHGLFRLATVLGYAGLAAVHATLEGWRWQMAPLYAASLLVVVWIAVPRWSIRAGQIGAGLTFLAVFATLMAAVMVPPFNLPPPGGGQAVGSRLYELVDANRAQSQGKSVEPRRLKVQLWYPAVEGTGAGLAAYRDASTDPRLMPQRWIATATRAAAEPALQGSAWPLVVFVHGGFGMRGEATGLMQELASRGYAVAAFDRSFEAVFLTDRNGSSPSPRDVATGAADIGAVLDGLNQALPGRMAVDRVLVIGRGSGGSIAAAACQRDSRIAAVVGIDAPTPDPAMPCPYLALHGEPAPALVFGQRGGWDVAIAQAQSADFSDAPFYAKVKDLSGAGPLPAGTVDGLVRRHVVDFADWAVGGERPTLLNGPALPGTRISAAPAAPRAP